MKSSCDMIVFHYDICLSVGGMRIIKMFSWEKPFIRMVLDIRNNEMTFIWKELAIYASFIAVLIVMPVIGKVAIV